ncbi:MAG TPA: DHA2 family efflux MFS transporter permease subunit [Candidatus Saccharimonadales bacterium]|nr:DHA2 family efflux MFS transporter permease subunit [Candidatus Saccharimonadales bacterium]
MDKVVQNQRRLALVVSILASLVAFIDGSVVNVALPAIVKDVGGGLVTQQWVVDSYLLTLSALILVAGSLADLFGRKRVMALGLIGFGITSVLCAIAPNSELLIIFRALQGIAGALLVPSSLALIIAVFEGDGEGKAIGTWTAWTGIAFIIGPLLGGFLIDAYSWRLIFAINVIPIAVTLWLLSYLHLREKSQTFAQVDVIGALLCVIGLGGTTYALIEQAHYGWSDPRIFLTLFIGLASFVSFIIFEGKTKKPMLPLELFKVRNFAVGNVATVAIYAGLSVAIFLITVFIQQVGGYSAIQAGMATLPVTVIMFVLSPRFGALSNKFGPRLFMAVGPLIAGLGFLLFLSVDQSVKYWTQILPGILIFGLGLSITVAPLTAAILGSIKAEHAGIGSAINNAVARVAGLIAIAALATVTGTTLNLKGFHNGVLAMAVLLFVGGIVSAVGIQNPASLKKKTR